MKKLLFSEFMAVLTVLCIVGLIEGTTHQSTLQQRLIAAFASTAASAAVSIAGAAVVVGFAIRSAVEGMVRPADANAAGVAIAALVAGFVLSVSAGFVVSVAAGFVVNKVAGIVVSIGAGVVVIGVAIAVFIVIRAAHVEVAGVAITAMTIAIGVATLAGANAVVVQIAKSQTLQLQTVSWIAAIMASLSTTLTAIVVTDAREARAAVYRPRTPLPLRLLFSTLTAFINLVILLYLPRVS